ncbi:hypothetical protein BDL97_17G010900, partial [Sphagnum fallax]
ERPRGHKAANTYNCLNNLDYVWYLNGKQKQLIKKLVHICMINGKKTRSHTIVYKTFHCLAHHGNILKLLVNTIKNVTLICEVKKVRIFCITQLIPSIIIANRQKTLVIRWMLETVTKTTYKQKEHKLKSMLI